MADNSVSQKARSRTELVSRRESWTAILVLVLLAIAVLLAFGNFVLNFRSLTDAYDQMGLIEVRELAIEQLDDDLAMNATAARVSESIERYTQATVRAAVPGPTGSSDIGSDASLESESQELTRLATGRRIAEMRELVDHLRADVASNIEAAQDRFEEALRSTVRAILFLGAAIVIGVFGGFWMFLRRSHRLRELLNSRTRDLEEVDRSRRLFFAKASHELRTPVTTMQGEAEVALADRGSDIEAMRESLEHVVAHAGFLGHRIEEMIGLARTADGQLHLETNALDVRTVVSGAIEDAQIYADSVDVAIIAPIEGDFIPTIGDGLWLRRALLAIIENALKFSPMGGTVDIALESNHAEARVTITDQGPGVSPDELPLIFDAYYQTDAGKQRGGSGLGLAMARWVIEQHGGSVTARNIGNLRRQGCSVSVSIPVRRSQ